MMEARRSSNPYTDSPSVHHTKHSLDNSCSIWFDWPVLVYESYERQIDSVGPSKTLIQTRGDGRSSNSQIPGQKFSIGFMKPGKAHQRGA